VTASHDLFLAILALDSYNRGYEPGIQGLSDTIGTQIGNATITKTSNGQAAKDAGFYAVEYNWDGTKFQQNTDDACAAPVL
jgi:hypothetical protein